MPIILALEHSSRPSPADSSIDVVVVIHTVSAGPITFEFTIDPSLPFRFVSGAEPVMLLMFSRSFKTAGEHRVQFTLPLIRTGAGAGNPRIFVSAAGIDGGTVEAVLEVSSG
jgi:hypothetical protein